MQAVLNVQTNTNLQEANLAAPSPNVGLRPMTDDHTTSVSKKRLWFGRAISGLAVLFLAFDGIAKLMMLDPVVEATAKMGYPQNTIVPIGVILLACVAVYVIPRTAVLGAVLLTGYLGGAIATHVRVGDPLFSHVLFPIYIAGLIWGGLYLRDTRARAILAPRR